MKYAVIALIALVCSIVAVSPLQGTRAAYPGTNGRIAFQDAGNGGQIWVMNPDGTGKTQVTDISGPAERPAFTADGTQIVYNSDTRVRRAEVDGPSDDGIAGTDGGLYASVSPDGDIAYTLGSDIIANGVNITNTPSGVNEYQPDYSPDGTQIVFARNDHESYDLFIASATGGNEVNLTNTPDIAESSPDWSPDGSQVIFDISPATGTESFVRIARIDADGSNYVELTTGDADFDPAYSPDGEFFVFMRHQGGGNRISPQGGGPSDIIVADADGGNQHSISGPGVHTHVSPDWGVDEPAQQLTWGDVNCDGSIDSTDALFWLTDNAGIITTAHGCPAINIEVQTPNFGTLKWGNLDCSEGIDTEDVLLLLRNAAGLPPADLQDCPALDTLVTVTPPG